MEIDSFWCFSIIIALKWIIYKYIRYDLNCGKFDILKTAKEDTNGIILSKKEDVYIILDEKSTIHFHQLNIFNQ